MECRFIKGHEDYLIFADGNVYSRKTEKMLKPILNSNGYYNVPLSKCGIVCRIYVHRLVAEAFIPNPENKPEINHKNGVKTDNHVNNLEWVTHSENVRHAVNTGLNNPADYLSMPVSQHSKSGELIAIYPSACEASRQTKISQGNITNVCSGKRKSAGGYVWKYIEENE